MERNWLIRTTQKQILGPVAKSKVLEFLQKGALGLNDEVSSGNGYWFSLREKELVDKYLLGDIPQSYNPISESKSVLAKRENPDKTTSLNASPANRTHVLKSDPAEPVAVPDNDELEYPDITQIITRLPEPIEATKLPTNDDLEFPDITSIIATVNSSLRVEIGHGQAIEGKSRPVEKVEVAASNEPLIYPEDSDLDYPDMVAIIETVAESVKPEELEKSREYKIDLSKTKVNVPVPVIVKITPKAAEVVSTGGLVLNSSLQAAASDSAEATAHSKQRVQESSSKTEDKKLFHEKKVKASNQQISSNSIKRPTLSEINQSGPTSIKKRNDNYLLYILVILILIILALFVYYYRTILNKPLPV